MIKNTLIKFVLLSLVAFAQGCAVYYKDLDQHSYSPVNPTEKISLSYRVDTLPVVASDDGIQAIEDTFKNSNQFDNLQEYYDETIPKKGLYIYAEPLYKAPGLAAMGFGYLSLSSLTLLPAWSNHDGYKVRYTVYRDGEKVKTLMYDRERFVAVWIALLPFAWINFFTSEDYDAFESITQEFLNDLPKVLG